MRIRQLSLPRLGVEAASSFRPLRQYLPSEACSWPMNEDPSAFFASVWRGGGKQRQTVLVIPEIVFSDQV